MKLCDTCKYRNNVEQLKPCIIYRHNCEYYEKERDMTVDREDAVERLNAIKQFIGYDKDSEIVKATQKSLDMAIKALEQEPRWIPVSERLPKLDVDVLVTDIHRNRFVHTLKHDSEDETFYWEDDAGFFVDFYDVIAWMPLPESYEPQESEE